ncbi:hypothetical protein ACP70R_042108 [Stipagrostis hirtigluma subsp. patula]
MALAPNKTMQAAAAADLEAAAPNEGAAAATLGPKLFMAARSGDSERLKDLLLLLKMAVHTIETEEAAAAAPREVLVQEGTLDTELIMAARRGDARRLKELLELKDDEGQVIVEVGHSRRPCAGASSSLRLDGVTPIEGDSLLHVVAACGDGDNFHNCATMIYGVNKRLLIKRNKEDDTPLHCAAGAGNANMVSWLVDLAAGGETSVKELVGMRNKRGETALHQAVRAANKSCIDYLILRDPELACIPHERDEGITISPLYLAISLGDMEIARHLWEASKGKVSYSGPDGRNVLHEAVSRGKALRKLLGWLKDVQKEGDRKPLISHLTQQRDNRTGSTPLHLAASLEMEESPLWEWLSRLPIFKGLKKVNTLLAKILAVLSLSPGSRKSITMLLDVSTCSVYEPDNKGRYPIHVAALAGRLDIVFTLLQRCPDCATLRDGQGRTFLHVAVESARFSVVGYACRNPVLSSILNMQDNEGDTALHLAIHASNQRIFDCLIQNPDVHLDVLNKKGLRPRDLSHRKIPIAFYYKFNPTVFIETSLEIMEAPFGGNHPEPLSEEEKKARDGALSKGINDATQVMGLVSVLVATVTFATAFTLPGGYVQSMSDGVPGTPVLAGSYAFDAFILADALSFVCSCLATFSLVFAGAPTMHLPLRVFYMNTSYDLMRSSVRSMVVAFALGLYLVLAPVAHKTAVAVCLITSTSFLHGNLEAIQVISAVNMALGRLRSTAPSHKAWIRIAIYFVLNAILVPFGSLIIIFGVPAIWHHTS